MALSKTQNVGAIHSHLTFEAEILRKLIILKFGGPLIIPGISFDSLAHTHGSQAALLDFFQLSPLPPTSVRRLQAHVHAGCAEAQVMISLKLHYSTHSGRFMSNLR